MGSNPIGYSDPTGHYRTDDGGCYPCTQLPDPIPDPDDDDGNTDTDGDGVPNIPDPSYPAIELGRGVQEDCLPGNLVECFYNKGLMPAGDYTISLSEYLALLEAIGYDVDKQGAIANYELRGIYDTPFYNGSGFGGTSVALKGTICISGLICSGRSEMNYIGQGTWAAAAMESPLMSTGVTNGWKVIRYGHPASFDTNLHNGVGYNAYMLRHPIKFILNSLGVRNSFSFPLSLVSQALNR